MEPLVIIAYRHNPITRAEIEAMCRVVVNPTVIKTLLDHSWIKVIGRREVPGKPEAIYLR